MNLFNFTKPSIAHTGARIVRFGNDRRPIYEEPIVEKEKSKDTNGIIKERVVPIPVMGLMLRTIVEPES